ncbi:MAG: hypothetical protein ACE5JS_22320 [Nitrospinota bacterium]
MNYFEARRAANLFKEYKKLALIYWNALPPDRRDRFDVRRGAETPESLDSIRLREQINLRFPEVNSLAARLGVAMMWQSFPPPAVGGPVIPVNLLLSVIDQNMGHGRISEQRILDVIDRCIGTGELAKRRGLKRLLMPWYWVIDIPAVLVRIPFLILRTAGLPATVEENIISQVIKVILVVGILLSLGYLGIQVTGIQVTVSDLLKLLAK